MTKWSQLGAVICLAAIPAALIASTRPAQPAANAGDETKRGNEVLLEAANAAGGEIGDVGGGTVRGDDDPLRSREALRKPIRRDVIEDVDPRDRVRLREPDRIVGAARDVRAAGGRDRRTPRRPDSRCLGPSLNTRYRGAALHQVSRRFG